MFYHFQGHLRPYLTSVLNLMVFALFKGFHGLKGYEACASESRADAPPGGLPHPLQLASICCMSVSSLITLACQAMS